MQGKYQVDIERLGELKTEEKRETLEGFMYQSRHRLRLRKKSF